MLSLTLPLLTQLACNHALPREERKAREAFEASTIRVKGTMSPAGTVTVGELSTQASSDGSFSLELPRENAWLTASADGHRDDARALHLMRPLSVEVVEVELTLHPDTGAVRWIFSGDTAVGRRYLDPDESTPRDQIPVNQAEALVRSESAYEDTGALLESVKPLLDRADQFVTNLESPVLDEPRTPHSKEYVFFTLPGSAEAIRDAGVDYVSLGNNHQVDYLDQGIVDTLDWMDALGWAHSGLGTSPEQAYRAHVIQDGGEAWSLISLTTVLGDQYNRGFIATDSEGGAANGAVDAEYERVIQQALAGGEIPIVQMHMGQEYTEQPSAYGLGRADFAAEQGAALFIGHHPHVVQGVGWHEGMLAAWSLGNFMFDQDRLETMMGATLEVDLRGQTVESARLWPIYVEDYVPRLAVGELADRFLRRVAGHSDAVVQVSEGRLEVLMTESSPNQRSVDHTLRLNAEGWGVVDLRGLAEPNESVAFLKGPSGTTARLGRDLLLHGGFEDLDIDAERYEVSRWNHANGDSRFPCVMRSMRGAMGMCSLREAWNEEPSVVSFRQRVRFLGFELAAPNQDVTLLGYVMGENAGPVSVQIEHVASEGERSFGEVVPFQHEGGDFDWDFFAEDLTLPEGDGGEDPDANPWAVKVRLFHEPPSRGDGLAVWDEVALVNWVSSPESLDQGFAVETPHAADFVRVQGSPNASVDLRLTFSE